MRRIGLDLERGWWRTDEAGFEPIEGLVDRLVTEVALEEFEHEPSRLSALRRAGEGTGGALAISAVTWMTGFLVMAMAPMPMFEMFGVLTAVMIFFSVLVSLLVLPSLLLLITPSRKGEERDQLIEEVTHGAFECEPHSRDTAVRQSR